MTAKLVYDNNQSLREKILKGVDVLADNVSSTLGPKGRNVILHQKGKNPIITKDGVSVAKFVYLDDPFENLGAQIIKQASEQTNNEAGDGTTTSAVLARSVVKNAQKYLVAGSPPVELKRGMDKAVKDVVELLEEKAIPVQSLEDVENIAEISANGDKTIAKLISTAIDVTGRDGAIQVVDGKAPETSLEVLEGFRFDSGYAASAFITDERRGAINYDTPLVLVTDYKVETVEEMLPILEVVARDGRPFVVVADSVEGQALAALIMNTVRGTMKIAAVKAPRFGNERRKILSDLALSLGATFITRSSGKRLSDVKLSDLGTCKSVDIIKNGTTFVNGEGSAEEIEKRIDSLRVELDQTDDLRECEVIQERITRLSSGVAIVKVGGLTEIEMIERKHRIEDALEAVRSAQVEGITAGGGVTLVRCSQALEEKAKNILDETERIGYNVVLKSIKEPVKQMALNAGLSPELVLRKVEELDATRGVDYSTEREIDMLESGVIDPVKVTRCALQNAVSAAGTLITSNHAIVEV